MNRFNAENIFHFLPSLLGEGSGMGVKIGGWNQFGQFAAFVRRFEPGFSGLKDLSELLMFEFFARSKGAHL